MSTLNTFTEDEIDTLVTVNKIIASISIFCCLIIIIIQWFFNEAKNFILTLVVWLCIANTFYCMTSFIPYDNLRDHNMVWCGIQALSIITFQYAGWIISCFLNYSLLITVIKKNHFEEHKACYKLSYIFITAIISLGLASM
jgi:hypothetical protein